jgi:hypothetical protein
MGTSVKEDCKKKSLMDSLDRFRNRRSQLTTLLTISKLLVDKIQRTEGDIKKGESEELKPLPAQRDLVDLFNGVDTDLSILMSEIKDNLESVIDLIE